MKEIELPINRVFLSPPFVKVLDLSSAESSFIDFGVCPDLSGSSVSFVPSNDVRSINYVKMGRFHFKLFISIDSKTGSVAANL